MLARRKKVCRRCKKKGIFNDAKQKFCNVCNHEINHDKRIYDAGKKKNYWESNKR
jgi:uncharacterized Zn ribbon protein